MFPNQEDALQYARGIAIKGGSEITVHRSDGTVISRQRFDSEPKRKAKQ